MTVISGLQCTVGDLEQVAYSAANKYPCAKETVSDRGHILLHIAIHPLLTSDITHLFLIHVAVSVPVLGSLEAAHGSLAILVR